MSLVAAMSSTPPGSKVDDLRSQYPATTWAGGFLSPSVGPSSIQYDHGRSAVVEEPLRALDIRSVPIVRTWGSARIWSKHWPINSPSASTASSGRTGLPCSVVPSVFPPVSRMALLVRAWRFWQEYGYRTENQALALRYTLTQAHNNLQIRRLCCPPPRPYSPTMITASGWARSSTRGACSTMALSWFCAAAASTSANLPSIDRMAVGGVHTVRGYRETS